ncbi:hypothetical protein [Brevundimonas olei]|uniref:phage fiber-tail adaptor protein n=1 Tax=Brevundimonas olei TaxID=657642 RepID=UPI0031DBA482
MTYFEKIKDPLDVVTYGFDFSDFNGTITSHELEAEDGIEIVQSSVSNKIVNFLVTGGEARKAYKIEVTVVFSDGSTINRSAMIRVEDL